MRKSTIYFTGVLFGGGVLLFLLFFYPLLHHEDHGHILQEQKDAVRTLSLTDLCLFTEARYTRHLSQADVHSAFQDHPLSLELSPSGSLTYPPRKLWTSEHALD